MNADYCLRIKKILQKVGFTELQSAILLIIFYNNNKAVNIGYLEDKLDGLLKEGRQQNDE